MAVLVFLLIGVCLVDTLSLLFLLLLLLLSLSSSSVVAILRPYPSGQRPPAQHDLPDVQRHRRGDGPGPEPQRHPGAVGLQPVRLQRGRQHRWGRGGQQQRLPRTSPTAAAASAVYSHATLPGQPRSAQRFCVLCFRFLFFCLFDVCDKVGFQEGFDWSPPEKGCAVESRFVVEVWRQ